MHDQNKTKRLAKTLVSRYQLDRLNSNFEHFSSANVEIKTLIVSLRSLHVYVIKKYSLQIFFSIPVNSGTIFTSISKNNC